MQQHRCLSCMSELTASPCPVCGASSGAIPDNQLHLPPGIILNNRYLVGKAIGSGGFGVVYIGWDTNLEVRVAVKEFLPKDIAGRDRDRVNLVPHSNNNIDDLLFGIERFIDEARVLARFQDHPGIVKVSESFKANNTAYMVMQYLDGMTLKEYLKRQPGERISFSLAIKALTPIMDALREVHKAGFVHRDISPDNIFINRQQQIKLLDFGAARYAMGEHSKSLTSILKQGYAPIEQYNSKGNQGPWTDVYALCATIYKCITAEIPPDATIRMVDECIRSPKQMGIDIPLQAELALMKGLALKAGERFESIQALQKALGNVSVEKKTVPEEQRPRQFTPQQAAAVARNPQPAAQPEFKGLEMVKVPGGSFLMGNFEKEKSWFSSLFDAPERSTENEKPVHEVCLDAFYIGKYLVTQGLWRNIMGNNPSYFNPLYLNISSVDDYPVESVSWNDIQQFLEKLNSRTGRKFRLPTEAEWEYAARSGGRNEKYSGGDNFDAVAWYSGNSGSKTHPVGQKQANGLGIYDMSGNVWEWCSDWYDENYYRISPRNNPQGPSNGQYRVLRGGSWNYGDRNTRADNRNRLIPVNRNIDNGFRLAVSED